MKHQDVPQRRGFCQAANDAAGLRPGRIASGGEHDTHEPIAACTERGSGKPADRRGVEGRPNRAGEMRQHPLCFRVTEPLGEQFQPGHKFQVEFKLLDNAALMTMFVRRA